MLTRLPRVVLIPLLATALGSPVACADIYRWVDASGMVNVSNLAPPEGAKVTSITTEPPPRAPSFDSPAEAARQREMMALAERARELEVIALSERVRHLEREVEMRRIAGPAAADYAPFPGPRMVQYFAEPAPPPMPLRNGCDLGWAGCGWLSGIYPAGVVVVGSSNQRRLRSSHGGHPPVAPRPVRGPPPTPWR